jgi:hypothetical protein
MAIKETNFFILTSKLIVLTLRDQAQTLPMCAPSLSACAIKALLTSTDSIGRI